MTADTRALEAVLFVSDEPLTPAVLSQALEMDRSAI
jgi:chromosome segregation and condensation protein ScpB